MYLYVKIIKILVVAMLFINLLFAKDIELRGKLIKISNGGVTERFSNQKICVKGKAICVSTYSKGIFKFKKIDKYLSRGEKIKLEITDKNWFMLSPFKGIYHVPNKSENIEVIMIPKNSSTYLTLFSRVSHYTIQVSNGSDEQKAIDMMNSLRHRCLQHYPSLLPNRLKRPCWRRYKEKSNQARCLEKQKKIYCSTDNIYYQSILRNNKSHNGFNYKVHFGKYSKDEYQKAKNDAIFIRNTYGLTKGVWITTYNKTIEDR